ncbi:MAG: CAP domain-containing protein [Hyphomonadaceae bacterium]|nr:CAP domain-containing protein [Hyphomonadaceae bacterium]
MNRTIFTFAALVLLGFPGGTVVAQTSLHGSQASASATTAAEATVEPAGMRGMLAAQNEARALANARPLTWSSELAVKATATLKAATIGSCPITAAEKAGKQANASIFWAPGLRRLGPETAIQDISPAYMVSRWRDGRTNYDVATRKCRTKGGACDAFSRMIAPKAKTVGCAKQICPNKTQIWACHYNE